MTRFAIVAALAPMLLIAASADAGTLYSGPTITFGDVLPLQAGLNTLVFTYTSLPAPNHAGFQGLGDEGWGVEKVEVGAVPEPATWAMLGLGFAGLAYAGVARGRRDRLASALA